METGLDSKQILMAYSPVLQSLPALEAHHDAGGGTVEGCAGMAAEKQL